MARAVYIPENELQIAFKDLRKLYKSYEDAQWRKEVMSPPATMVEKAARKRQGKSKAIHYYYRKRKTGGRRRPAGTATNDRIAIIPGNLRTSIQFLRKLKKTPFVVIGPNIIGRLGGQTEIGRTKSKSSGFYAWMAKKRYSGAEGFRADIMEPALSEVTGAIISHVNKQKDLRLQRVKGQLSVFR